MSCNQEQTSGQQLHKSATLQTIPKEENGASKTIEKGRLTRFHFEKVLNFDYCLLVFVSISIFLSVIYSDADYLEKKEVASYCMLFMEVILIAEIAVTIARYKAQIQLQKSQKILDQQETILTSGRSGSLILEIIVLLLQPYSFFQGLTVSMSDNYDGISFDFKLNYILVFLGFSKLFIILRVVLTNTIYMSPRSSRMCRMYGCQSNYLYAIKCLFKDSPMLLIGVVFVSSIIIFALSLRIAQRDVTSILTQTKTQNQGSSKAFSNDISYFQNALWLTIITMTTVGYGDYYPRTIFGRLIDVILVVWGTFIVSLMVVVLTNTLNMDQSQKRALIVLNRLQAKKTLKEAAALLITHSCKKYLLKKAVRNKKRAALSKEEQGRMENTFYKYLTSFQSVHRSIRSMYQIDDVYEEMTRQFEFINDEIGFLLNSQKDTIDNLQLYLNNSRNKNEEQNPMHFD